MAMATKTSATEKLVRKDKLIVFVALATIVVLAGTYTVLGVGMDMSAFKMTTMASAEAGSMTKTMAASWTPSYFVLMILMWWIMMIAMMTPSAAPTILLYTALKKFGKDGHRAPVFSAYFLAGYLLIWAGFSVAATLLQWVLGLVGLIDVSKMTVSSNILAGLILICAGFYQFSSLKNACLEHCRSPASFLAEHNRPGLKGAIGMGVRHGFFCLGCCWALMALLFVGGIMNLYWITALAVYVIFEKYLPIGALFVKISGAILIFAGTLIIVASGI